MTAMDPQVAAATLGTAPPEELQEGAVALMNLIGPEDAELADRLRVFLRVLAPEATAPFVGKAEDAQIDLLFGELRTIAARGDAREEARYQRVLRRIRELQRNEAQRMGARFDARRPLRPGEVDEALRDARAILGRHGDPSE